MRRSLTSLSKVLLAGAVALSLVACNTSTSPPKEQTSVPQLTSRVMDTANILTRQQKSDMITRLREIDKQTKTEIVVYTFAKVPENEDFESYALKVFNTWKIGKKDLDSGVLIINAITDKKIGIEVGRGNEGYIADSQARRIIKDHMVQHLVKNKFNEAYLAAIGEIEKYAKERGK